MTTFESILLLAVTACVIITAFGVLVIKKILKEIADKQYANGETLSDIRGDTVDIFQELNNIEDNILDDLRDIRLARELDKTSPNVPIYTPCYAPDGICMNPYGDCINCPKRGTGGTWSTNISIKAKDAPLQERFNDNKED